MSFGAWATNLTNAVRSYRLALRASSYFGRSITLRKTGQAREALAVARQGLLLLGDPVVRRQAPPEGAGIISLTIQVEQLAEELGEPGAGERDLRDAAEFLRAMPSSARGTAAQTQHDWLPYFEARLAALAEHGGPHE